MGRKCLEYFFWDFPEVNIRRFIDCLNICHNFQISSVYGFKFLVFFFNFPTTAPDAFSPATELWGSWHSQSNQIENPLLLVSLRRFVLFVLNERTLLFLYMFAIYPTRYSVFVQDISMYGECLQHCYSVAKIFRNNN